MIKLFFNGIQNNYGKNHYPNAFFIQWFDDWEAHSDLRYIFCDFEIK